jgi:hypothetical protein
MSATTSPALNSYGVAMPEPTDKMLAAVAACVDGNTSRADYAASTGTTTGTLGNAITNGLRRMGREADIGAKPASTTGTGTTGTTKPKATPKRPVIRSRADSIRAAIIDGYVAAVRERDALVGAVDKAEADAEGFDAEAWIATRTAELDAAIEAAEDARKAFLADADANADAEAERLRTHADTVRDSNADAIAEAEGFVADYTDDDADGVIAEYVASLADADDATE